MLITLSVASSIDDEAGNTRMADAENDRTCVAAKARRRAHVAASLERGPLLASVFKKSPREIGSCLFHGFKRDVVYAVCSEWVAQAQPSSTRATVQIPGCELRALNGIGAIEVDLDGACSADIKAFFKWICKTIQSRHVLGKHVIVVHAADRADGSDLKRIVSSKLAILVASSVKPDAGALRDVPGILCVRVACEDALAVPTKARDAFECIARGNSVQVDRVHIHELRKAGFTSDEVARYASACLGSMVPERAQRVSGEIATLAYFAGSDERASEVLVALMRSLLV